MEAIKAALTTIKQSAIEEDMNARLELERRRQIVELIDKGYFDPILGSIQDAALNRIERLSAASQALVDHFRSDR